MGTSRRRTPPGARLAGPRGRPDRFRGRQKTSKSPFGFKWQTEIFRGVRALEIIQLGLASHRRFTKWIDRPCWDGSLIGSTREGWSRFGQRNEEV
jgi:hypothetical protein